jgi:hypothetical protein
MGNCSAERIFTPKTIATNGRTINKKKSACKKRIANLILDFGF